MKTLMKILIVAGLFCCLSSCATLFIHPFSVVIETEYPAEDFVIWANNHDSIPTHSGVLASGGGYMKATYGPSNTKLNFPWGFRLSWNFIGGGVRLQMYQPHYLLPIVHLAPADKGMDYLEIRVEYPGFVPPSLSALEGKYVVPLDKPVVIHVKAYPIEKYMKWYAGYAKIRESCHTGRTSVEECINDAWHIGPSREYFAFFKRIGKRQEMCEKYADFMFEKAKQYDVENFYLNENGCTYNADYLGWSVSEVDKRQERYDIVEQD